MMASPTQHDDEARRRAEERARTMLEQAAGRAEAIAAAAVARAVALCRQIEHETPELHTGSLVDGVCARSAISAGGLQEAVTLRAYFRAEQRGFAPGLATEDWLEAERELTAAARALADEGES
jgi:hypothetical protein